MAPRVTVTMTALNGNLDPAIRVLDLDVQRVSIPVGRASKTISKGLQGKRENAWFDSPVMSRDHAELMLDLETDALSIQDIGSMHGTFLNGTRIESLTPTELNDGDEIVFGAEVRRGTEIFPACAFRISYELVPYKATNSYAFPDTSDNEDLDEVDFTDEESEMDLSSEDDESVIIVGQKSSQSIHAIDLTREESPEPLSQAIHTRDATSALPMVNDYDHDSEDGMVYTPNDDDMEANVGNQSEHYSSEDESDSDASLCEVNDEGIAREPRFEPLDDEDAESSVYDDESDMGASSSQEAAYVRMAEYPSSPTVIKGADRMIVPDDESNDFGLAKAGEEGMRAMVDAGMVDGVFLQRSKRSFYPYAAPCYPSVPNSQLAANSPVIPDTFASMSQLSSSSSTGRSSYPNRQPSPSDAAMAKIPDMKDAEIPLSYVRSSANLGQGSGKEEFFKARELNKATIQNQDTWFGRMPEFEDASVEKQTFSARPIKACATKRMRAMAAANAVEAKVDGDAEVKEPVVVPTAEPTSVPNELPVVGLMVDLQPQATLEPVSQPIRSGLTIDELIDRNSSDQEIVAPKRKAEEISKTEIEDLTVWASALIPTESHSPTPAEVAVAFSAICGTSEQPPAKKLRKFMEKVTYAALGGVAVGAALFGSLVATAPDFM